MRFATLLIGCLLESATLPDDDDDKSTPATSPKNPMTPTTDPKTETPIVAGASHTPPDGSTSAPFSQLSPGRLPQTTSRLENIPAPPRRCPKLETVTLYEEPYITYDICDKSRPSRCFLIVKFDKERRALILNAGCTYDPEFILTCKESSPQDVAIRCNHAVTEHYIYNGTTCCAHNAFQIYTADIYNSWFPYVAEDASDVDKEKRQYSKEFLMDSDELLRRSIDCGDEESGGHLSHIQKKIIAGSLYLFIIISSVWAIVQHEKIFKLANH
ncbi:hypothetical protein WR25_18675 [Diploscapter pachys]|uniref:Uncharacterized protein n=1 Tax=Diploscapter pachys TaxID=2018661 RepID=A0A2A2JAP1_9BILA|nr:hypothetical protein WR25_18675 [Diploscapter pachys]